MHMNDDGQRAADQSAEQPPARSFSLLRLLLAMAVFAGSLALARRYEGGMFAAIITAGTAIALLTLIARRHDAGPIKCAVVGAVLGAILLPLIMPATVGQFPFAAPLGAALGWLLAGAWSRAHR